MRNLWLVGIGALLLGCGGASPGGSTARTATNTTAEPANGAPAAPTSDSNRVEPAPVGAPTDDDALGSLRGDAIDVKPGGGGSEGFDLSNVGDRDHAVQRRASTPPSVKAGDSTVTGSLTKDEIRRVIRRNLNRVRYCYEKQLILEPKLAGKATTKFTIGPDGKVISAEVQGFGSRPVDECIHGAISAMVFPPPKGGGVVVVSYPFVFAPADSSPTDGGDGPASP